MFLRWIRAISKCQAGRIALTYTCNGITFRDLGHLPVEICSIQENSPTEASENKGTTEMVAETHCQVSLAVDIHKLLASPKKELLPLLSILEDWQPAKPQDVKISQISGAMTNLIFRCQYQDKSVLARVFGSSGALFEREAEQQIFAAIAHAGLGPKLLLSFANGRLEEFLLDQSVTARQMRTPPVAVCVAAAMAMFNFTQLSRLPHSNNKQPICWERLRRWAASMHQLYTAEELAAEQMENIDNMIDELEDRLTSTGPTWMGFCHNDTQYGNLLLHTASDSTLEASADAQDLLDSRNTLEDLAPQSGTANGNHLSVLGTSPPSYSSLRYHMKELSLWHVQEAFQQQRQNGESRSDPSGDAQDVWAIERPDDLEECEGSSPRKRPMGVSVFAGEPSDSFDLDAIDPKLSVRFIDYEYAGFNPVALDVANHWCEYAADYHSSEPHILDYTHFPNDRQQKLFTRAYVRAVMTLKRHKEESGLPARADSLSHSLAVSAAISGCSLESDVATSGSIEHIAQKVLKHLQVQDAAQAYVPVSHLSWGIWGFLQARLSDVPSFNFTAYGRQRLQQYRKTANLE